VIWSSIPAPTPALRRPGLTEDDRTLAERPTADRRGAMAVPDRRPDLGGDMIDRRPDDQAAGSRTRIAAGELGAVRVASRVDRLGNSLDSYVTKWPAVHRHYIIDLGDLDRRRFTEGSPTPANI
jgi:hypothetical protein